MNKCLIALLLVANFPIQTSADPLQRACLFHGQIYKIMPWEDIDRCPKTLAFGVPIAGFNSSEQNPRFHSHDISHEMSLLKRTFTTFEDIPHDPECFTSEPY